MSLSDVYVSLVANITNFVAAMAQSAESTDALGASADAMGAKVTEAGDVAGAAIQAMVDVMDDSLIVLKGSLDTTAASADAMAEKVDAASSTISIAMARQAASAESAAAAWDLSFASMQEKQDQLEAKMAIATTEADAYAASLDADAAAADSAGASLAGMSTGGLAIAAGAVVAAGVVAVKAAADFQTLITKLATSGGELQSNLQADGDAILALAGQVGLSANTLATAMYTATSAGYQGADAVQVLTAAAKAAVTEQADLGTVTNALTDLLKDYGLSADNAGRVTSEMMTTVSEGKTTFQDLSAAMSTVSPIAAAANIPMTNLLGTIAEMTSHGVSADEATQQIANAIRSLESPSQTMTAELGQIGISSTQLSQSLGSQGLTGALQEIQKAILQNMGPAGTVLLSSFNQSSVAAQKAQQAMAGLSTQAQALAQQYASGAMTGGFAAWQAGVKSLSAPQANLLNQWKALQDQSQGFSNALKSGNGDVQTYTSALQKATGTSSALQVALLTTGSNAAATNEDISKIGHTATNTGDAVSGFAEQQQTLNAKLNDAKAGFGALVISVGQKLMPLMNILASVLATVATWLEKHTIVAKALAVVIGGPIAAAFALMLVALASIALALAPFILLAKGVMDAWGPVSHFFEDLWNDVVDAFNSAVSFIGGVLNWIAAIPGDIASWFEGLPDAIGHIFEAVGKAILSALEAAGPAILKFFQNLPAEIGYALGFLAGTLVRIFVDAIVAARDGIVNAWKAVIKFFQDLPGNVESFFIGVNTWLDTAGSDLVNGAFHGMLTAWVDVTNWFGNLPNVVEGWLSNAGSWLLSAGSAMLHGLLRGMLIAWVDVTNWFNNLPNVIGGWFSSAGTWLLNAGTNLLKGLWQGIENAMSWLWHQITSFASSLVSGFEKALGIGSPSKLMADRIGKYIPAGIAQGMKNNMGVISDAAKESALAAITGSQAALSTGALDTNVSLSGTVGTAASRSPAAAQTIINMNIGGSVVTQKDLAYTMQTIMAQLGQKNSQTYQKYKR